MGTFTAADLYELLTAQWDCADPFILTARAGRLADCDRAALADAAGRRVTRAEERQIVGWIRARAARAEGGANAAE